MISCCIDCLSIPVICGHLSELKKPIGYQEKKWPNSQQKEYCCMRSVQDHRRTLIHVTKCLQICTYFHEREIGWFDNDTDQSKLDTKFFILNFDPIKNEKSLPKNWDHLNDRDYATYDHVIQSNCTKLKNLFWLIMYD